MPSSSFVKPTSSSHRTRYSLMHETLSLQLCNDDTRGATTNNTCKLSGLAVYQSHDKVEPAFGTHVSLDSHRPSSDGHTSQQHVGLSLPPARKHPPANRVSCQSTGVTLRVRQDIWSKLTFLYSASKPQANLALHVGNVSH